MATLRIKIENISETEAKRLIAKLIADGVDVKAINFGGRQEQVDRNKRPLEVLKGNQ